MRIFRDALTLRFGKNFVFWIQNCILNNFYYVFLSNTQLISLVMFNMSLNLLNHLYQMYINVRIKKNATVGLYVNSNVIWAT